MHVEAPHWHQGESRHLVHRFKYQADLSAGRRLAAAMAPLLADARVLVPVPRAVVRRYRYGIDPGTWLAEQLARTTGVAVARVLRSPLWWPAHARDLGRRPPRFRTVRGVPAGAVLVDDVVTTGSTLLAAGRVSGVARAVAATMTPRSEVPGRGVPLRCIVRYHQ